MSCLFNTFPTLSSQQWHQEIGWVNHWSWSHGDKLIQNSTTSRLFSISRNLSWPEKSDLGADAKSCQVVASSVRRWLYEPKKITATFVLCHLCPHLGCTWWFLSVASTSVVHLLAVAHSSECEVILWKLFAYCCKFIKFYLHVNHLKSSFENA